MEYEFTASFVFENLDSPSSGDYLIHNETKNGISIHIERKIRRKPLLGMKQPTPSGAILGWESFLLIKKADRVANGYRWKLNRNNQLIQEGRTDDDGEDSLDIELSSTGTFTYKLEVFSPFYGDNESCNN